MAETISVQSGYILESDLLSGRQIPLKFIDMGDGSVKLICEIIIPKNTQGLKINEKAKPDDPAAWEYGEIEIPLNLDINEENTTARIYFLGSGPGLSINIKADVIAKKVWQMANKVWQLGRS